MTPIRCVFSILLALLFSILSFSQTAFAAQTTKAASGVANTPLTPLGSLAPLPTQTTPVSSHAPFEAGDCKVCHQNADPQKPGPVLKQGTALCLGCHEEFADVLKRQHTHEPARTACTNCHNPHNATSPKLMLKETRALCTNCHDKVGQLSSNAKVKHKALTTGAQCSNCHDPHASAVEKLLRQLPFDLCLSCHNVDTMTDENGKKLLNMKTLLDKNKVRHGPVRDKDCSGCHVAHGSNQFRLLEEEYPATFYAPYDAQTYALCFSCHNDDAFSTAKTTTLTKFRNGDTNLHYVHLQQPGRGRTCRACHEVHASNQKNQIRDGVPYGSGGWLLKLNYTETATGGTCEKTCHAAKTYDYKK